MMPVSVTTPSMFAWLLLGCSAIATLTAGVALGFSAPAFEIATSCILVGGLLAGAYLIERVWSAPAIAEPCRLFAFWIAMLTVLLPGSYIAAALDLPMIDKSLSQWDRAVGFDWLWWQQLTAHSLALSQIGSLIYEWAGIQLLVAVLCLASIRDLNRLNTYMSGLLLATILTIILSGLFPAIAPYHYFGITDGQKGFIQTYVNVPSHIDHYLALRAGTLRHLDIKFEGILTFPSYHTVVAVITGWATWRLRWIGPLNALFSTLVVATTLPIGGHHLMDVVGGAVVTVVALRMAAAVETPGRARAGLHTLAARPWVRALRRRSRIA